MCVMIAPTTRFIAVIATEEEEIILELIELSMPYKESFKDNATLIGHLPLRHELNEYLLKFGSVQKIWTKRSTDLSLSW